MNELKSLNKRTAPKSTMPERIIQFGEGNFLRAFVDWIVFNMNQKTDFNASVVVVQPIEHGMVDWLNGQDCLYHLNLQGKENGQPVNTLTRIDAISRALNNTRLSWLWQSNPKCDLLFPTPPKLVLPLMKPASLQTSLHPAIPASWFNSCSTVTNISMEPPTRE